MEVCVLATSYPRSADDHASPFVHGLARALVAKGVAVTAVVPHETGLASREILEGVVVERFRYAFPSRLEKLAYGYGIPDNVRYRPWTIFLIPLFLVGLCLRGWRSSARADLLHVHWELAALAGLMIARARSIPVVFTVHRIVARRPLSRFLTRALFRRMDHLHFNSSYTRAEAHRLLGYEPRGEVIPPSIEWSQFENLKPEAEFRKRWNIPHGPKLLVSVGRMVEKKGFVGLIDAFAGLQREAILVIAGGGPLLESLREKVLRENLSERVFLPGFLQLSDVRALLAEATLGVFPSIVDSHGEVETLGVAAIEALACGLPVIASAVGGMVDVIQHEKTGLLVPPGDVKALQASLERLLAHPDEAQRLANAGRQHVRANFIWEVAAARSISAYKNCLKGPE